MLAVWTVHVYALPAADCTPYLHVTGPELRCGKSRVLDVLRLLVPRALVAAHASPAAIFRALDRDDPPALFLDEVDGLFGRRREQREGAEDLRALLNAGYARGTGALRCVGQGASLTVHEFRVYSAKALAGIGELPGTLADRSLRIAMQRLAPDERVERLLPSRPPAEAAELRKRASAWAAAHLDELRAADPEIPGGLDDRGADVCLPLFAIADASGGDWPERIRAAVVELRSGDASDASVSYGIGVLTAVRRAFAAADDPDALSTAALLDALADDDEVPAGFGADEGARARRLSRTLRPYGIKPGDVHVGEAADRKTVKGYRRDGCEPAWRRYTPSAVSNPRHPRQPFSGAGLRPADIRATEASWRGWEAAGNGLAIRAGADGADGTQERLTRETEGPLAGELLGALALVRDLAARGLDIGAIAAATGLDATRVAGALDGAAGS